MTDGEDSDNSSLDVDTSRFMTCPVTGESVDTTDPDDYQVVTIGNIDTDDGIMVSRKTTFPDVIETIQLVDGRLAE